MNEWDLQRQLSRIWRKSISIEHHGHLYRLVCWELMFPSWQINYKLRKWNEPSIDFILFDGKERFLCLELKNTIKNRKELLTAYCQVTHRAVQFLIGYSKEKITSAREHCEKEASQSRGGAAKMACEKVAYPASPVVERVIAAVAFPREVVKLIRDWNTLTIDGVASLTSEYATSREFERLKSLVGEAVSRRLSKVVSTMHIDVQQVAKADS